MTSTNNNTPRANLYTFAGSIWGSVRESSAGRVACLTSCSHEQHQPHTQLALGETRMLSSASLRALLTLVLSHSLIEKGYGPDDLDIRSVDLLKGENCE